MRIVLDARLRTPLNHRLITQAANTPTWFVHHINAPEDRIHAMRDAGIRLMPIDDTDEFRLDVTLRALATAGLTRVLVEGGAQLAASLLRSNLIDQLAWFQAPSIIGCPGVPAVAELGVETLQAMPGFRHISSEKLGKDILNIYRSHNAI